MKIEHEEPFLGLYSNKDFTARSSRVLSHVQQLCNSDLEQYQNGIPTL